MSCQLHFWHSETETNFRGNVIKKIRSILIFPWCAQIIQLANYENLELLWMLMLGSNKTLTKLIIPLLL